MIMIMKVDFIRKLIKNKKELISELETQKLDHLLKRL